MSIDEIVEFLAGEEGYIIALLDADKYNTFKPGEEVGEESLMI